MMFSISNRTGGPKFWVSTISFRGKKEQPKSEFATALQFYVSSAKQRENLSGFLKHCLIDSLAARALKHLETISLNWRSRDHHHNIYLFIIFIIPDFRGWKPTNSWEIQHLNHQIFQKHTMCGASSPRFLKGDILRPLPRRALEVILECMLSFLVPRQLLPSNMMKVSRTLRILVLRLPAYPIRNRITALCSQYLLLRSCG